jgi:hypothetical protein
MPRKSRGSALLALAFHLARRRRWTDAGEQVDAVKCEAARLRMPYDTATVADAVAIVRASKVRQGCNG